jgi:hypothetical protein
MAAKALLDNESEETAKPHSVAQLEELSLADLDRVIAALAPELPPDVLS